MRWHAGQARGWIGEELAVQYLTQIGFEIIDRNVRYGRGELDIVCRDAEELVFVEVKTRRFSVGDPVQMLSERQEKMLKHTASGYIQENIEELTPTRFDVVGVLETDAGYTLEHVRNALTG